MRLADFTLISLGIYKLEKERNKKENKNLEYQL